MIRVRIEEYPDARFVGQEGHIRKSHASFAAIELDNGQVVLCYHTEYAAVNDPYEDPQ